MQKVKSIAMEIWKDIEGYEGLYQVSNEGRVKSLSRVIVKGNKTITTKEKILKQGEVGKGYLQVCLYSNSVFKHCLIHRLVAKTFLPNLDNKPCVGHSDCNPKNNNVKNLYWCTYEENNNHIITKARKEKIVFQYTTSNELVGVWGSINKCVENGYRHSSISDCCHGRKKTHKGYRWSFEPL